MTELKRLIEKDPDFSSLETVLVALIEKGDPDQPDFGLAAMGVDVGSLEEGEQGDWHLLVKLTLGEFKRRRKAGTPLLTLQQQRLMTVFEALLPHLACGWPLRLAAILGRP
jgi:hypothetical protein